MGTTATAAPTPPCGWPCSSAARPDPAGGEPICKGVRHADRDDAAGDGAGPRCGHARVVGARHRRRAVLLAVLRRADGLRQPRDAHPARCRGGVDRAGPPGHHGRRTPAARPGDAGQGARHRRPALRRSAHRRGRCGRPRGGLPRRRCGPLAPDDARDGRAGRGDASRVGGREGHRRRACRRTPTRPARRASRPGRHDGASHGAARRDLGRRPRWRHPGPRHRVGRGAVRPRPSILGRRRARCAEADDVVLLRSR